MASNFLGHKRLIVFFLTLFLAFLWMTYQVRSGNGQTIKGFLDSLLSTPQRFIGLIGENLKGFSEHYILLVGKSKENERLVKEIEGMKGERNSYLEIQEENRRLKSLLSLKEQRTGYVATVKVIGRDYSSWFRSVMIDKGERDGIRKDMVAITPSGLVGRVYHVMPETARVILITDRSSALAARVVRTRDEGILQGTGEGLCRLKYLRQSTELEVGDILLTSGLDGIFPEGLNAGTISHVERKGSGFFQDVEVTPASDLARLDELTILKK